jgi:hypothetical protein
MTYVRSLLVTVPLAITLALNALNASAFDHQSFCKNLREFAVTSNQDAGSMLDAVTRHDGMAVLCNAKIVDFKKFILVNVSEFRDGWRERKQFQWNNTYCTNEAFRPAIDAGWTIASTVTFKDGSRYFLKAVCR